MGLKDFLFYKTRSSSKVDTDEWDTNATPDRNANPEANASPGANANPEANANMVCLNMTSTKVKSLRKYKKMVLFNRKQEVMSYC